VLDNNLAFAATGPNQNDLGYVLKFAVSTWTAVDGGLPPFLQFVGLDGTRGSLFAANLGQVFVTHDLGSTWLLASEGLPTVAHSSDLHWVLQTDATQYVYLATYGWSIFRARLP